LNKAFKLNLVILIKNMQWDRRAFNWIRDVIIILVVLVGGKYGFSLIPVKAILPIYWMMAIFMFGLPISDVSYVKMSAGHWKMQTYFKHVPLKDMDRYYTYRRFTMFTIWGLVLFFPLSIEAIPVGFFTIGLLGAALMFKTSVQRLFKDERKTQYADVGIKMLLIGSLIPITHGYVDPEYVRTMVYGIPLYYFIIWIVITYGITYINVGANYGLMQSVSSRTVRSKYIKDHHLLYILRGPLLSTLVTIFLFSFISFDRALLNVVGFASTVLSNYFIIYQGLLQNDKDKIQLLYRPNELHKIRLDKLPSILKFSVIYFVLAVGIGVYMGDVLRFILSYVMTTLVFIGTVSGLKINIEKGKNSKIATWQDGLLLGVVSTVLVLVVVNLI